MSKCQLLCKIFLISFICLLQFKLILCQNGLDNITGDCINKCHEENQTNLMKINDGCGKDCYMNQCQLGCSLWEQALSSSCQKVCNKSDDEPKEIFCTISCNDALSRYFKWIITDIGTIPEPALVPNTLSNTSLTLAWKIPKKIISLRNQKQYLPKGYLVQWRYADIADDWKLYSNQSISYNSTVHIDNLMPYKKYRFRVVLPLSISLKLNEMLVSEESDIISTLESGLPLSEPKIVRAVAVDHTRIFISWEHGPFINGPLLSYSLELKILSSENLSAFKEIPATENTNFYIFEKLLPSKNYSIKVSMHNKDGDGPQAKTFVATPSAPIINENESELRLILGSEHSIVSQGSDFLFDPPKEFYKSDDRIMGVAIHISKSLVFVSDETGHIYKAPLEQTEKLTSKRKEAILSPKSGINFLPTILSVDWLNDHLYILGEVNQRNSQKLYQITRCNLNGQNLIVAIAGLYKKPNHIQVDPINGFLYWSISGNSQNDGLYRIDLADISNDIKPELRAPFQLIESGNLGAFVIDYLKYKIYIPGQLNNTIYAYSLDGKIKEDIRSNTQSPKLNIVKSITIANGIFYWTNGNDLFSEDYHAQQNNFYHNEYPGKSNSIFITVALQSAQPLPIPLNPPRNLEALLSSRKAKIMWNKPDLLSNQGKGSWQEWYYELKIIDDSDVNNVIRDIKGTYFTVDRLKPNTNYTFLALAYTINGHSSYSAEFQSKTLKSIHDRYLIWSTDDGLLQSDIIGEHIHPLISKNKLDNFDITDITWFEDMLFFISNSTLKYYNRTSNNLAQFNDIESVESIDIDWIGKKIYWSIPSQQYVTRANFNGLDKEILPILGVVKEFKIDSLNGHIYYSTGFAIEACRLNGKNRISYTHFQLKFSTIMGLTLDLDQEKLYWIVRSYNGSNLYSAPLAQYWRQDMIPNEISLPSQTVSQSLKLNRLTHFSDRLMWLQDDHTVIVSDNRGKNLAHIQSDKLNNLKSITVIDPTHHVIPINVSTSELNVIPESINNNTIKFSGLWHSFNISWEPVRTVTYGEIFYEIRIRHVDSDLLRDETSMPQYLYKNHTVPPYTLLDVSIRPFTYWGSAKTSIARLYSLVAAPSEPINPKVFVAHQHDPFRRGINISAIFRWSRPDKLNGPTVRYKIFCWYKDIGREKIIFNDFNRDGNFEIIIPNLTPNITYYFQSQGFSITDEAGPKSSIIYVNSSQENPIPKLLLAKQDEIVEIDMNLNKTNILVHTSNPTYHLAYIKNEKTLFWLNENNEIIGFTINENGGSKRKIALINGNIVSLTIDWIQRIIYWVQHDPDQNNDKSIIYRLDLNRYDGRTMIGEKFLSSTEFIKDLSVSPINQQLYWIQNPKRNTKFGNLIQYSINLGMELELPNNITCLNNTFQRILFDTQSFSENRLILVSSTERIFSYGLESFQCELIKMRYDNLTKNIAKDSGHVYLLRNNTIFSYNNKQTIQYSMNISKIIDMLAYNHQNYPHKLCLLPRKNISNVNYIPELMKKTENSLYLQLPQIDTYSNCTLKLPGIKYFIQYFEQISNKSLINCPNALCKTLISYDPFIEIMNLKPFIKYNLRIGITNFYAQQIGLKILYGPSVTFSTAPGAPSTPRNLTGEIISPNEAILTWFKPEILNSDKIWYVIFWQMEYPKSRVVHKQQRIIVLPDENLIKNSTEKISISLIKLLPNQKYTIWIQAYSTNTTLSKTPSIELETFSEPENITLLEKTANSLRLHWQQPKNIHKYILEYSINNSVEYKLIVDSENDTRFDNDFDENYNENLIDKELYLVNNLQPKTIYRFSVRLFYLNRKIPYIWPPDNRYSFETFGDRPSAPGKPKIHQLAGDVYKISWEPSKENGATVEEYSLEGLQSRVSNRVKRLIENDEYSKINYNSTKNQLDFNIQNEEKAISVIEPDIIDNNTSLLNQMQSAEEPEAFEENWLMLYNGTENYCIKNDFNLINSLVFRVRARNLYGWGSYSIESEPINEPYISPKRRESLLIAIFVPTVVIVICFIFTGCMIFVHQKRATAKRHLHKMNSQIQDVELANLRELPCGGNFIHSSNIIYSHGPLTDADIALLPQIRRNQIQMSCFLGSGAFGEVYEGVVKQDDKKPIIRVAIKTLRKGATDQEKNEFLQEAQLMSNFKHKHILQLIGICFDTESLFIIMELMEGGDLLTYLRQSRPHMGVSVTLTLADLISICVDVATGCRYLEEMHFVHRDLACRNCLVSSTDPEYRVVKIGDFGLARDIYKNDYYRKEGEGLLPVRWMSPESLVDGVFTSQSDIWAFGVLCWEIMTMGQQPYPARNNVEVLHFVRDGGRLGRPEDCPDGLYQLMLKCWSYRPEERPTFRYCLEILHLLQSNPNEKIHIEDHYVDNTNSTIGTLKLSKFDGNSLTLVEPPIILTPTSSTASTIRPRYIELLYEENSGDEENHSVNCCDDYEIPIENIRNQEYITETPPIENFDRSSVRNSLCSSKSITIPKQLKKESQHESKLSVGSVEKSESNLDIKNSSNLNKNNNLRQSNSSNDVNSDSTERKKSLQESEDNLNNKDSSSMKSDNLSNDNNDLNENLIENNQNKSIDDTKM